MVEDDKEFLFILPLLGNEVGILLVSFFPKGYVEFVRCISSCIFSSSYNGVSDLRMIIVCTAVVAGTGGRGTGISVLLPSLSVGIVLLLLG